MTSYKEQLNEAISSPSMGKAIILITRYLRTALKTELFAIPELEQYKNSVEKGFGIRFYIPFGNRSLRLNWVRPTEVGSAELHSFDAWFDEKHLHIELNSQASLVRVLPYIADVMLSKGMIQPGEVYVPDETGTMIESAESRNPVSLTEAVLDARDVFDGVLKMLPSPGFKKGDVWAQYKGAGMKVFDAIVAAYPRAVVKDGPAYKWAGSADVLKDMAKNRESILSSAGTVKATVSILTQPEKYTPSASVKDLEQEVASGRLSYDQQLEDLENLIKLTLSGSANAVIVGGRGGIGKTFTVEKVLADAGLKDGEGYFKVTGSATAAGIYSLLFKYKTSIVLFDDADAAFGDQESRNIFKAATDTKKVRKLVWNKMGKNIVEPGDMEDQDMLDQGLLPRYFEFTGKVIIISNLSLDKLDPDGALRTRAYLIDISPTDDEVYQFMYKIVDKIELPPGMTLTPEKRRHVIDLLKTGKSKQTANLRKMERGLTMAAASLGKISDEQLARMIASYA